ncbi:MAG: DUF6797 domain-containing protein, partial [Balneolaceae bacterium]
MVEQNDRQMHHRRNRNRFFIEEGGDPGSRRDGTQGTLNPFLCGGFSWSLLLLLAVLLSVTGCRADEGPVITENNFQDLELADFVEPGFPFITTSVDARGLGEGFPTERNVTPRCLALQLGEEAYACFDTDMLRWSVAWTGDFLPMVTMAQISYKDFFNKDNQIPYPLGNPQIATGVYPGWTTGQPDFTDPRQPAPNPDDPKSGPIPPDMARWQGVSLQGEQAVLHYTVGGVLIRELPSATLSGDQIGFTRTIQIDEEREEALTLSAAEITDLSELESEARYLLARHESSPDSVTAIGLRGDGEAEIVVEENRFLTVSFPAGSEAITETLVLWRGPVDRVDEFETMMAGSAEAVHFDEQPATRWQEVVRTQIQQAPDTSAFVTDLLPLPVPNPWQRNIRASDIAFFSDGRAAVVTFEGDVWLVDGIGSSNTLEWRRFASGLYETQSIEIVDDEIYVFGKDGLTRLSDRSGNGEADWYENFSNLMGQSMETREWASDLVAAPDGGFFVAKGGALDMGPRTGTRPVAPGFRGGSHQSGTIVKISEDGRDLQVYATGLRGPYIGIHPENGILSVSDQQGHQVPSTPIYLVEEGDYFGVVPTAHRDPVPEITPPLTWIPHSVDRSGMSQVWVTGDQMGPLSEQLVHISFGQPGLFQVLMDEIEGRVVQGGVSVIPGLYPAPMMKGAVSPVDEQLYVIGFNVWDSNSSGVSALVRLHYTGEPGYLPAGFSVREGGIMLRFSTPLDEAAVQDISNWQVQRWEYRRTEEYGSGHFRLDGEPGQEHMPVFSAHLSDDSQSVWLAVPDIQPVEQMEIRWTLESEEGIPIDDALWFSVNEVHPPALSDWGFEGLHAEDLVAAGSGASSATRVDEEVSLERGRDLFRQTGCIGCHSVDGEESPALASRGSSMAGLFGSER